MTTAEQTFVIVGAGLAGAGAAEALRAEGSGGRIAAKHQQLTTSGS